MNHKTTYKIVFQGASLDVGNRGCCALAASFLQLAKKAQPNSQFHFLYGNKNDGAGSLEVQGKLYSFEIVNCRMSLQSGLQKQVFWIFLVACIQRIMPKAISNKMIQSNLWLSTLQKADFVGEIRGGDSFSDIYGFRRFFQGMLPTVIALMMKKDLVMLPQTYGPYSGYWSRKLASLIMKRAALLISRDQDSFDEIKKLMGKAYDPEKVLFCPDMAFVMQPGIPAEMRIDPPLKSETSTPLIGFNVSGLLYMGGYSKSNMFGLQMDYKSFVNSVLQKLLEETEADILLVPHVFAHNEEDELQICRRIKESLPDSKTNRVHTIEEAYDQNRIKGMIGFCDFFIGSRMHACIAAISQGIPAIGIAYSKKFKGVFESVGIGECVLDARTMKSEEIQEAILEWYARRHEIKEPLTRLVSQVKEQIQQTFCAVMK